MCNISHADHQYPLSPLRRFSPKPLSQRAPGPLSLRIQRRPELGSLSARGRRTFSMKRPQLTRRGLPNPLTQVERASQVQACEISRGNRAGGYIVLFMHRLVKPNNRSSLKVRRRRCTPGVYLDLAVGR